MSHLPLKMVSLGAAMLWLSGCVDGRVSGDGDGVADVGEPVTGRKCPDGATVPGIDVSVYQGNIGWGAVAASGQKFAIARVGDGYGIDSKFAQNWAGIKSAGLIRGAYQFFEPGEDPVTQANLVIARVGRLGNGDLPVMLDMEVSGGQSAATITARIHQWVNAITAGTGKTPFIYTGAYFWDASVRSADFAAFPLNVAWYGTTCPGTPNAWSRWAMHQYSSSGSVPGIAGNVDMNVWNGTLAQLQAFAGQDAPVAPVRAVALSTTTSGYALDGFGKLRPFGGAPERSIGDSWSWDIARDLAVRADGVSGYVLDGWGALHEFGGAPAVQASAYWQGWDIARAVALRPDGVSGYTLDGYGGIHPFGGAPVVNPSTYWSGWDIARSIALRPDGNSGYVLDGYGGLHEFGGAPPVVASAYWSGWDIARKVLVSFDGVSGYTLDGYGNLHPFGKAIPVQSNFYTPHDVLWGAALGHDARSGVTVDTSGTVHPYTLGPAFRSLAHRDAESGYGLDSLGSVITFGNAPAVTGSFTDARLLVRDLKLGPQGTSGYVLDGWGGVHPFGGSPAAAVSAYWPDWDIARRLAVRADGQSGYTLDGYGGIHPFGGAPEVGGNAYWGGWDIARDLVLRADGVSGYTLDGFGGLHAFGGSPELSNLSYWQGWDIARAVALSADGKGGYLLDGFGGVHAVGTAAPAQLAEGAYFQNWDVVTDLQVSADGKSGHTLDVYGQVHAFTAGGGDPGTVPPVQGLPDGGGVTGVPSILDGGVKPEAARGNASGRAGDNQGVAAGCSTTSGGSAPLGALLVMLALRRRGSSV